MGDELVKEKIGRVRSERKRECVYKFGKEVRRARNKEWNGCRRVEERSEDELEIKERGEE